MDDILASTTSKQHNKTEELNKWLAGASNCPPSGIGLSLILEAETIWKFKHEIY
jgi:hypothetical protein